MGSDWNHDNLIQKYQDDQARDRAELDNLRTTLTGYQIKVEKQENEIQRLKEDNEAMAAQVHYWRNRTHHWIKQVIR